MGTARQLDNKTRTGVKAEAIRLLYAQCLPGAITQLVIISILSFLFLDLYSSQYLPLSVAIFVNGLLTIACILRYRQLRPPAESSWRWGAMLVLFNGIAGLLWGLYLQNHFQYDDLGFAYLSVFMIAVINVASAPVLATYFPAYVAFAVLATLPFSLRLINDQHEVFYTIGWLLLMQLALTILYAHHVAKTWISTFLVRYENNSLVSQLRQEKDSAEESRRIAEQANIAKSKFLAAASHDLRQPLHALSLFTEVLALKEKDPEQKIIIDNMKGSVAAMEGLFNALLDISKLDGGIVQPKLEHLELSCITDQLLREYESLAAEKGLAFWCKASNIIVHTDPGLLEVIIRNLLGNAIRYTQQGTVWVAARDLGHDLVAIEIGDTGIGIAAESQQDIFKEFYQLHNPERDKSKGMGLGLAIVKRLIGMLGYELQLESEPGRGTRFVINLPKGKYEQARLHSKKTSAPIYNNAQKKPIKVMVIDDDQSVRTSTRAVLEAWGYTVFDADSGEAAVEKVLSGQKPDILIVDYQLRDNKTGIQAIDSLSRMLAKQLPVLVITGDIQPEHLSEAERYGYPIAHKPIAPSRFRSFLLASEKRLGKTVQLEPAQVTE